MIDPSIELIPTDELLEELGRRHKAFFAVARGHGGDEWRNYSHGGSITDLLGMIEFSKAELIAMVKANDGH